MDSNIENIKKFITENIIVDRFPIAKEVQYGGKYTGIQVIINVSDEFYLGNDELIIKNGKLVYYFPMGEILPDMGVNSLYGAMQVLYHIYLWHPEWKVLLHCQAGRNRSPTVKAAFHYMMTGEHLSGVVNRLIENCNEGYLPTLPLMEAFLSKCKEAFDNQEKFFGGIFDWIMSESGLSTRYKII